MILLCLLVCSLTDAFAAKSLRQWLADFEKLPPHALQRKPAKAAKTSGASDVSVECALCGIALNELMGLLGENRSETAIQDELLAVVCPALPESFQAACRRVALNVGVIAEWLANQYTPTSVCVRLSLCPVPYPNNNNKTIDYPVNVTISLDLPPQLRFRTVCSIPSYQQNAQFLFGMLQDSIGAVAYDALVDLGQLIYNSYLPSDFAGEIAGCAAGLNISTGMLTFMNLAYELTDLCTSIVALDANGVPHHARNIDFGIGGGFTATLRETVFVATFTRNSQPVFIGSFFAGYLGVLSGMRYAAGGSTGAFSMTVDTRFQGSILDVGRDLVQWIEGDGHQLVATATRHVMESDDITTYADARAYLRSVPLVSEVYFIVGGLAATDGTVLARNFTDARYEWPLDAANGTWFTGVTNYDLSGPQPWYDDRWDPARQRMSDMGQAGVSPASLMTLLGQKPTLNMETAYSIIAVPKDGTYQCLIRYCAYPCVE